MNKINLDKVRRNSPNLKESLCFLSILSILLLTLYFLGVVSSNPNLLYGLMGALFIPPAGKESIIPLMLAGGIEPLIIFSAIFVMDLAACFIILTSFEVVDYIALRTPVLRKHFIRIREKVEKYEKYELISFALIGFMFLPFQGTGAISTSLLAQFLRLPNWKTILIILIGSVVSSVAFISFYVGLFKFI